MADKYTKALNSLFAFIDDNKGKHALEDYKTIQNLIERYENIVKAYYDYANYKIGDYELIMTVGTNTSNEVVENG